MITSSKCRPCEPSRTSDLAPERERLCELCFDLWPCLRAPARVQHRAQHAVDAEPGCRRRSSVSRSPFISPSGNWRINFALNGGTARYTKESEEYDYVNQIALHPRPNEHPGTPRGEVPHA